MLVLFSVSMLVLFGVRRWCKGFRYCALSVHCCKASRFCDLCTFRPFQIVALILWYVDDGMTPSSVCLLTTVRIPAIRESGARFSRLIRQQWYIVVHSGVEGQAAGVNFLRDRFRAFLTRKNAGFGGAVPAITTTCTVGEGEAPRESGQSNKN